MAVSPDIEFPIMSLEKLEATPCVTTYQKGEIKIFSEKLGGTECVKQMIVCNYFLWHIYDFFPSPQTTSSPA